MRNVLTGIADVCRVLALLILAVGAIGVGYMALVTRLPASAAPLASADKIGPTYARAPAPIATAAVRAANAVEKTLERVVPQANAATQPASAEAATPLRPTVDARVQTANLETGTLSDATGVGGSRSAQTRTNRRVAGAAGCEYFRSFDPATQTYRTYDGRIRECRVR